MWKILHFDYSKYVRGNIHAIKSSGFYVLLYFTYWEYICMWIYSQWFGKSEISQKYFKH